MSERHSEPTAIGVGLPLNWLLGGALGGAIGSVLFGAVLWAVNPEIITEVIPNIYGLESGSVGWAFHVVHGLVLGIAFGFIVTREPILGTVAADVETGFLAGLGLTVRFGLVGIAYGMLIWAVLPLVLQTVAAAGGATDPEFPIVAIESLLGHMVYGALLGVLFAVLVEVQPGATESEAPFEEAPENA